MVSLSRVSYYGHLFVRIAEKNVMFAWKRPKEKAFRKIKEALTKREVLPVFETCSSRMVWLSCGASETGIGAVLEQEIER